MKTKQLKRFLLLMVLALLLVSLPACAASRTFTQDETDAWAARCIADYGVFGQIDTLHYSEIRTYRTEKREATLSNAQVWFQGNDFLKVDSNEKGIYQHIVAKGGIGYWMPVTESGREVWIPESSPEQSFSRFEMNWENRGYQFESIQGKGDETEVTFFWNLGNDNCTLSARTFHLTFCYEADTLKRIVFTHTSYTGGSINPEKVHSIDSTEYVFHSTPGSEITAKIDEAYQKATGK
jgi:hypothetical protein